MVPRAAHSEILMIGGEDLEVIQKLASRAGLSGRARRRSAQLSATAPRSKRSTQQLCRLNSSENLISFFVSHSASSGIINVSDTPGIGARSGIKRWRSSLVRSQFRLLMWSDGLWLVHEYVWLDGRLLVSVPALERVSRLARRSSVPRRAVHLSARAPMAECVQDVLWSSLNGDTVR